MFPFRSAVLFSFLLIAGCSNPSDQSNATGQSAAVQTYQGVGVIKTITATKNYVNIDHEEIPGLMEAMTMFFPVQDTSILRNVAVNDSVAFTIEVNQGKAEISNIWVTQ